VSALTYRIPRNLDFISGRSFCDSCGTKLFWYDNIPLLSYVMYFGKSRCCNKKISLRYPLIEVTTAIGGVYLYLMFGFSFLFVIYSLLFLLSFSILIIDIEHQIIPDELSWIILILGIFQLSSNLYNNLFFASVFSLVFLFLHLVTLGRGMGLGDVKLAFALGIWLGLEKGVSWLITSFIIGGIVAFTLLLLKKAKMKTKIAFGPFLIIGFWATLLLR
jgi:leader peptidase (prepilin peptidase)/N-methyltransferase